MLAVGSSACPWTPARSHHQARNHPSGPDTRPRVFFGIATPSDCHQNRSIAFFRDYIDHVFRRFLRKCPLPVLGLWLRSGINGTHFASWSRIWYFRVAMPSGLCNNFEKRPETRPSMRYKDNSVHERSDIPCNLVWRGEQLLGVAFWTLSLAAGSPDSQGRG